MLLTNFIGDNVEFLKLYKKFGIELMVSEEPRLFFILYRRKVYLSTSQCFLTNLSPIQARLTDVVFSLKTDIGTTMEVLPASEDKSKILRILDLENFTSPEDLENIIPRSSSVLEVSVSDIIFHINNRSLSTDNREETKEDLFSVSSVLSKSMEGKSRGLMTPHSEFGVLSSDNPDRAMNHQPFQSPPDVNSPGLTVDTMMSVSGTSAIKPAGREGSDEAGSSSNKLLSDGGSDFQFSDDGRQAFGDPDYSSILRESILAMPTSEMHPSLLSSKADKGSMSFDAHERIDDCLGTVGGGKSERLDAAQGLSVITESVSEDFQTVFKDVPLSFDNGTIAVTSVVNVGDTAVCSMVDGSYNFIKMSSGHVTSIPPQKSYSSADLSMRLIPIPPSHGGSSIYAGVSFSGDVYKTSAAYAGIQFKGQGFLSASRQGGISAWAMPESLMKEEEHSRETGVSLDEVSSNWRLGSIQGNAAPLRSLLISTSTSSQSFSMDGPPGTAHVFASNTSWQICSGDSKGFLSIHRGDGVVMAQKAKKGGATGSSATFQNSSPVFQNFNSESVRSLQTQVSVTLS